MSGKCYPEEFKIEVTKQVIDRGHSVSSVAIRHVIVSITVSSRWVSGL